MSEEIKTVEVEEEVAVEEAKKESFVTKAYNGVKGFVKKVWKPVVAFGLGVLAKSAYDSMTFGSVDCEDLDTDVSPETGGEE